ncbi:sialidase family protein [Priestia megaterium]|uniref:sialidase family protein n=1 Tax=Priestia megaterium TaxID=1404 RepID=UPI001884FF14|nr:sialidase family protein [Priestia megaterium]
MNLLQPNIMVAVSTDTTSGVPQTGLYRSLDGGANWSVTLLPLPTGFTGAEAAAVCYKFPTTFIVTAHVFPGEESGTTFAYISTDNGQTFGTPFIVGPGYGTYINNDETNLAVDNSQVSPFLGNVYVVYNHQFNVDNFSGSAAFLSRSGDGGNTFSNTTLLSNEKDTVERPDVTAGITGIIYAGWITTNQGSTFYIKRSFDGGVTFEANPITVSNVVLVPQVLPVPGYGFRVLTFANLATDRSNGPNSGTIYAVWQDNRLGYSDVFLSKSVDRGATWSTPVSITGAPQGSQNFFPAIDVDPLLGVVNVVYYTNRLTNFNLDVFIARSIDGGNTFTNQRVTTTSFNPNGTSPTPAPLIGDYIDVDSVAPGGYIATWADTRTGSLTIFAGYNTDPVA